MEEANMSSGKVAVTFVVGAKVEQELLAGCIVVVSSMHRYLLPTTLERRLSRLATRRDVTPRSSLDLQSTTFAYISRGRENEAHAQRAVEAFAAESGAKWPKAVAKR